MSEEEIYEMYGGENNIFEILLNDLKEGTFSDCDEKFQYCCYQIITNLQQELTKYKERNEKAIEYVKNTYDDVVSSFTENKPMTNFKTRKELLEILEDKEKKDE